MEGQLDCTAFKRGAKKANTMSELSPIWFEQWTADGYLLLPHVFTPLEVEGMRRACATALAEGAAAGSVLSAAAGPAYGARNLLRLWPEAVALVRSPRLGAIVLRILGERAGVVRGLYFDKPPGNSWALPWHRDLTIAVKKHGTFGKFRRPTVKSGVPHVEAPTELLAGMLTARIHLDAVTDRNGPLRVLPGSHAAGRGDGCGAREPVAVCCNAGDVLLMRPLLLHSSSHSEPNHRAHRRIVHLEMAAGPGLPEPYEWHDFVAIDAAAVLTG
jgi:hypothetical protein